MSSGRFDDVFLQIAGQLGGIEPLLDEFFGFLSRKTDFYVEYDSSSQQKAHMGFPQGMNEKMVLRSFKKFPMIPYQTPSPPSPLPAAAAVSASSLPSPPLPHPEVSEIKSKSQNIRVNESNAQIPIGNGGIAEHYYWTQTLKELTVYIDLDFQAKGKDIQCTITPSHLTLSVRGQLILDDDFEEKVCVDESMWTISSDSHDSLSQVILTLDKSRKTWWKHVLVNDPEIDTTKVDSTQKVSEYDEETQAAIRKIMFDQKQKRMGIRSDDDPDAILEKAMYAPSSPFLNDQLTKEQT